MIYAYEDPYQDWEAYEADRAKADEGDLHCDECGERIWDVWYDIEGVIYCPECIRDRRRVR